MIIRLVYKMADKFVFHLATMPSSTSHQIHVKNLRLNPGESKAFKIYICMYVQAERLIKIQDVYAQIHS